MESLESAPLRINLFLSSSLATFGIATQWQQEELIANLVKFGFNFFAAFLASAALMHDAAPSLTQSAISSLKTTLQVQKNCTKKFTKNHLASPVSFSLLNKTPRQGVNSLLDANVALIVVAGGELAKTGRKKGDFWASSPI